MKDNWGSVTDSKETKEKERRKRRNASESNVKMRVGECHVSSSRLAHIACIN